MTRSLPPIAAQPPPAATVSRHSLQPAHSPKTPRTTPTQDATVSPAPQRIASRPSCSQPKSDRSSSPIRIAQPARREKAPGDLIPIGKPIRRRPRRYHGVLVGRSPPRGATRPGCANTWNSWHFFRSFVSIRFSNRFHFPRLAHSPKSFNR